MPTSEIRKAIGNSRVDVIVGGPPCQGAYANVGEAIGDLVDKHEEVPNHIALAHGDIVTARYRLIPEGGKLPPPDKLPPELRRGNFGNTYQRLSRKSVASTMVPGNNAFPIHPTLNRSLTPREAARIQTFPDADLFCGAGGFTQGLEDAGLKCVLGVDFEKNCTEAYRINHKDHECLQLDLSSEQAQTMVGERLCCSTYGKNFYRTGCGADFPSSDAAFADSVDNLVVSFEFKPPTETKRGILTGLGQSLPISSSAISRIS